MSKLATNEVLSLLSNPPLEAVYLLLALPHILYAFIWFFPSAFQRMCLRPNKAVDVFASLAGLCKVGQFGSVLLWTHATMSPAVRADLPAALLSLSPMTWSHFVFLVTLGQALNVGIYKAIGKDGVYYGFKLGKKVPWHNGFPFNVCPHPQYVGSALTVWGCYALLHSVAAPGLLHICIYWTMLYVITGLFEEYL